MEYKLLVCLLWTLASTVDSVWWPNYSYDLDNTFGAITGLSGWQGSLWNSRLRLNQPCNFCSKTNARTCCYFKGKCCNNEYPACIPQLQCRRSQECKVDSNTYDFCSIFGCCRLNDTHCCPQLAATVPFDPFLLITGNETSSASKNFLKLPSLKSKDQGM